MSRKHPVIAITGSSGAGTTSTKRALEDIFHRIGIKAAAIEGDSYHSYNRADMKTKLNAAIDNDKTFSHFGPDANRFDLLEDLFRTYGETGTGKRRYYLHSTAEAKHHNCRLNLNLNAGEFTPWEPLEAETDLLFYEGLHGMVVTEDADVAQHVDLGIGVVPIINLEWIQKIHRDSAERGYSPESVVDTILRRMPDYVNYITPQFSRTDINFQRVPTIDTSNPFIARNIPTAGESFVIIRVAQPRKFNINFPYLLSMIRGSFMSRHNTMVIPGDKFIIAMEIMLGPIIENMLKKKCS